MGMIDQLKAREEQKRPIRIGMIGGENLGQCSWRRLSVFRASMSWVWLILMLSKLVLILCTPVGQRRS